MTRVDPLWWQLQSMLLAACGQVMQTHTALLLVALLPNLQCASRSHLLYSHRHLSAKHTRLLTHSLVEITLPLEIDGIHPFGERTQFQ
jgi:hypothetical protein